MRVMAVILLVVLLVSVSVITLRRSSLPPSPPIRQEIVSPKPALSPALPRSPRSSAQTAPVKNSPSAATTQGPVDVSGPLKDRGFIRQVIPPYPEWAEEEGIAGTVSVKIWVDPDGAVRSFMQMQRTSPSTKLDDVALDALRQWRFRSIPNAVGDQWGVVTFRFTL